MWVRLAMFNFNTRPNRSASSPAGMGAKILAATGLSSSKSLSRLAGADVPEGHTNGHTGSGDLLSAQDNAAMHIRKQDEPLQAKPRLQQSGLSRQMPSVYAAMLPAQRSSSAPASYSLPGCMLGPVCGVATSHTTRQLLTKLLQAQTAVSVGHPKDQIAAQFDAMQARQALLRRDLKQGQVEELADTPIERVFESVLAEELVNHMPKQMLQPMQQLSRWMAREIERLEDPRAERVMKGLLADLRKEHPRPWSAQQPLIGRLCDGTEPWATKRKALTDFLKGDLAQGSDALAAMVLLRSSFLGYKAAGLDTTLAPWLKDADRTYQSQILPKKSGAPHHGASQRPVGDQMAGITNLGQASPVKADHLVPGLRATYRERINLASKDARESIAWGNPVAAGTSGTTNMFLHAVSHHNALPGAPQVDGAALTTLLAALTCYDGGHSLHEVLSVGHLLSALPHVNMPAFAGYAPGHARGVFVDLATKYGATDLAEVAFTRLEEHYRDVPVS